MSGAGRRRKHHVGGSSMRRKPHVGGSSMSKIGKVLKDVNKIAKKTKILSAALSTIPHPAAQALGGVARSVGYGRKRKHGKRRKMHGRGTERLGDTVLGIGYQISNPVF